MLADFCTLAVTSYLSSRWYPSSLIHVSNLINFNQFNVNLTQAKFKTLHLQNYRIKHFSSTNYLAQQQKTLSEWCYSSVKWISKLSENNYWPLLLHYGCLHIIPMLFINLAWNQSYSLVQTHLANLNICHILATFNWNSELNLVYYQRSYPHQAAHLIQQHAVQLRPVVVGRSGQVQIHHLLIKSSISETWSWYFLESIYFWQSIYICQWPNYHILEEKHFNLQQIN